MEQIGAVQLGNLTNKKFLTGLIPSEWQEKVYKHNTFWACKCKRNNQVNSESHTEKQREFDNICKKIENEFGKYLMEIYSITSAGIHFVVYLHRKKLSKNKDII